MRNLPSLAQIFVPTPTDTQEIILHLSAENLKKMDALSKSDPIVVLFLKESSFNCNADWVEIGKTDVISNNSNPSWVKTISVNYVFETRQELRFDVYDVDNNDVGHLHESRRIGSCFVDLTDIILSTGRKSFELQLNKEGRQKQSSKDSNSSRGTLHIDHEKAIPSCGIKSIVYAQITGLDFEKQHWYRKNRVFFKIFRKVSASNDKWIPIYESPYRKKLDFFPFQIRYEQMTIDNDPKTPLKLEFFDSRTIKQPKLIGSTETTFDMLMRSLGEQFPITKLMKNDPKKEKKSSSNANNENENELGNESLVNSGVFRIDKFRKSELRPFLEFIENGLRLDFMVVIDFTGSNGYPKSQNSLHFISDRLNQYQTAMLSVGEVISSYVTERQYKAYGFGFSHPKLKKYIEPLTLDRNNEYVNGLDGLMDAYKDFLPKIRLLGPTEFAPIIQKGAQQCKENFEKKKSYTIMLIMTDGAIEDEYKTASEIIDCSTLPLSIIIVGVGGYNFNAMEALDSDDEPLYVRDKCQGRDLVQFVPFNEVMNKKGSSLEKEVLKEIPFQISAWAELNNLSPEYFRS